MHRKAERRTAKIFLKHIYFLSPGLIATCSLKHRYSKQS